MQVQETNNDNMRKLSFHFGSHDHEYTIQLRSWLSHTLRHIPQDTSNNNTKVI